MRNSEVPFAHQALFKSAGNMDFVSLAWAFGRHVDLRVEDLRNGRNITAGGQRTRMPWGFRRI
jgi:hypothetical protein